MSQRLHLWIDLVFGAKQRGESAKMAFNVFHPLVSCPPPNFLSRVPPAPPHPHPLTLAPAWLLPGLSLPPPPLLLLFLRLRLRLLLLVGGWDRHCWR